MRLCAMQCHYMVNAYKWKKHIANIHILPTSLFMRAGRLLHEKINKMKIRQNIYYVGKRLFPACSLAPRGAARETRLRVDGVWNTFCARNAISCEMLQSCLCCKVSHEVMFLFNLLLWYDVWILFVRWIANPHMKHEPTHWITKHILPGGCM